MIQTKVVQINTYFMFNDLFSSENLAVYEITWKNTVQRCRPHMTIWHMRIACRIPNATNTHSQHVLLIAFALQLWLHEHASMLRYSTVPVLLIFSVVFRPASVVCLHFAVLRIGPTFFLVPSIPLCCYH